MINKKLGRIEQDYGPAFFDDYEKLIIWIEEYSLDKDLPILHWETFMMPIFTLVEELQYRECYSISSTYATPERIIGKRIFNALRRLKKFDIYQKGYFLSGAVPTFNGSMSDDFIQFKGECYNSFNLEFFTTIFLWLDYYLVNIIPKKIRVEFWLTYFNTSASKRFLEFFKTLELYKIKTANDIKVYWYFEEEDIDSLESGQEFQKELILDFEIIELSKEQYKKMSK